MEGVVFMKKAYHANHGYRQQLPKKATVTERVRVGSRYECTVAMWVPDIPYSSNAPGIALTLRHGYGDASEYFRLIFKESADLQNFVEGLNRFVTSKLPYIADIHKDALMEWIEAQAKRQNPEIDVKIEEARKYLS